MDEPTTVPADCLGVIVHPDGAAEFLLPKGLKDDDVMSDMWIAVLATVMDLQQNPERRKAIADQYMHEGSLN